MANPRDRSDWTASLNLLRRMAPRREGWASSLPDCELVAWRRLLRYYAVLLQVESRFSEDQVVCLVAIEERLLAVEREARERPILRNLSLVRRRKSLEEMTRPGAPEGSWRGVHGRRPELGEAEENAIVCGGDRGLPVRAMARTLALGIRPVSDLPADLEVWFEEVSRLRRHPGRPSGDTIRPGSQPDSIDMHPMTRRVERVLQASRFMDEVVACGVRLVKSWPVAHT